MLVGSDKADSKPADAVTNYLFCGDCGLDTGLGQDLFATSIPINVLVLDPV